MKTLFKNILMMMVSVTMVAVSPAYAVSEEIPDIRSPEMSFIPKVCSDYAYKTILHNSFYKENYAKKGAYTTAIGIASCEPDGKIRAKMIKQGLKRETQEDKKAILYMLEGDSYYTDNWSVPVQDVTINPSESTRFLNAKASYIKALESVINNPNYPKDTKRLDAYYEIETGLLPRAITQIIEISDALSKSDKLDNETLTLFDNLKKALPQLETNINQEAKTENVYAGSIARYNKNFVEAKKFLLEH